MIWVHVHEHTALCCRAVSVKIQNRCGLKQQSVLAVAVVMLHDFLAVWAACRFGCSDDDQYVGGGWGSRDLAKLFVSSFDADLLDSDDGAAMLAYYHGELTARLVGGAEALPLSVLQDQFSLGVADYTRHMAGWGFWGNVEWAQRFTDALLQQLDAGADFTEEQYAAALRREFPRLTADLPGKPQARL